MESRIVSKAGRREDTLRRLGWMSGPALVGAVLLLSGCALVPGRKPPAPTEPPPPVVEFPVIQYPEEPPPEEAAAPPQATSTTTGSRTPTPRARREAVPDTVAAPQPATEPTAPPSEPVLLQLTEGERVRLSTEMYRDLAVTNVCLQRIDPDRLGREERRTLSDVHDLLESVAKARADNDVQAAARLARKARLLAEDLTNR